jgi:S1-C subfamily serine protease
MSKKWRLLLLLPFLILPFALILSSSDHENSDLYEQPKDYFNFVSMLKKSTIEIQCGGDWIGSGWGIEVGGEQFVVTAFHVIEDCVEASVIRGRGDGTESYELELLSYDGRYWNVDSDSLRDLAVLRPSRFIHALKIQTTEPKIGQWLAASGYPADSMGDQFFKVVTGRITSLSDYGVFITDAAINHGNSGGPAVNSRGEVVGTVFAGGPVDEYEDVGEVQGMELHCDLVFLCFDGVVNFISPTYYMRFTSENG